MFRPVQEQQQDDLFCYSILIDNIIMSNKDGVSTSELNKAVLNKEYYNELEMITGECSEISTQSLSLITPTLYTLLSFIQEI